jgi:hypothetical protein
LPDVDRRQPVDRVPDHFHVEPGQDDERQGRVNDGNRDDRLCPIGPVCGSAIFRHELT